MRVILVPAISIGRERKENTRTHRLGKHQPAHPLLRELFAFVRRARAVGQDELGEATELDVDHVAVDAASDFKVRMMDGSRVRDLGLSCGMDSVRVSGGGDRGLRL